MPRLARPKRRARDEHQQLRVPAVGGDGACEALELRLPQLLAMLNPTYFGNLAHHSTITIPSMKKIATRPRRSPPKRSMDFLASVSLSQTPPSPTPPQPDAQGPPDSSTRLPLPQWLSRAMQGQLPAVLWVVLSPPGQPDKRRLMTVDDFFRYTEEQGMINHAPSQCFCIGAPTTRAHAVQGAGSRRGSASDLGRPQGVVAGIGYGEEMDLRSTSFCTMIRMEIIPSSLVYLYIIHASIWREEERKKRDWRLSTV